MIETNVVEGYEISWHVIYISRLLFCVDNKTDIKPSYRIYLLKLFIGSAEGTCGMLLNGNLAVRIPCFQ